MLARRLQILLDERQYARLSAYAAERNLSVGAAVRDAIDRTVSATTPERVAAARTVLEAPPMPVPPPQELAGELEALRTRRA
jgi:hypothetical protein